jgi:AcrR family transcriptional regulator
MEAAIPRQTKGVRTRTAILEEAARLATVVGIEGISIGGLATATGMSKSGLYAHFGSKEELQLATIDAARASFIREVVSPALRSAPGGRERLLALCEAFLSYVERRVFPGGCFFVVVAAELGSRPGAVHDRVATYQRQWTELLRQAARDAAATGELSSDEDPDQLAFELGAIATGANIVAVLHSDDAVIDRARRAIRRRLQACVADRPGPMPPRRASALQR